MVKYNLKMKNIENSLIKEPIYKVDLKDGNIEGKAVFESVTHLKNLDNVFEDKGVKVLVDPKSLIYLDGTEVDFTKEGLNEGFKFNNPNVKDSCGCGESFTV